MDSKNLVVCLQLLSTADFVSPSVIYELVNTGLVYCLVQAEIGGIKEGGSRGAQNSVSSKFIDHFLPPPLASSQWSISFTCSFSFLF